MINTVDYFDQNYKLNYEIKNYKTIKNDVTIRSNVRRTKNEEWNDQQ